MSWYFAFFFVSGLCSLVYEVVWLRLAMAAFGVTTPFLSIVLSVFMAGLALGSWGSGRLARAFERRTTAAPLRLYALSEALIGLGGIAVPRQLAWGREVLAAGGAGWESGGYYLASGAWIALTLLPYCVCMGATFPLAMAAIWRGHPAAAGVSFSYLYLANVLGATAGTLLSAFVLIEMLGFHGTLGAAAVLNGLLALSAFLLSLAPGGGPRGRVSATASPFAAGDAPPVGVLAWLFVTGLVSMAMEVVWVRQFTPYLGTVVYTFATILALYLAATFLGSRLYRTWLGGWTARQPGAPAYAWLTLGALALVPLVMTDVRFAVPATLRVAIGIVPVCAVIGFLTPMLVDRWSRGHPERAGRAYAVNVVGSLLGPVLASFWLLPVLGERGALAALAVPLFVAGALVIARPEAVTADAGTNPGARTALFAGAVAAALLVILQTKGYETVFPAGEIRRDHTATVIATGQGRFKQMLINGQGITSLTPTPKMMAHLPLAFLDRPPRDALVVAFGMGTTFRSLLSWGIPATAVELVPSVPDLFAFYHRDGPGLLRSPLARIAIDDGRRFLERSTGQWDVITIDPPPPVETAGSSLLYSREFYATVTRRLRPDGIVHQWFPLFPGGEAAILASVARALGESFPHVRAFRPVDGEGFHFLATLRPLPVVPAAVLAARMPPTAAADLVEWGPAPTAEEQFRLLLGGEERLAALMALAPRAPAIRDDRPFNEYYLIRRWLTRRG